jgi:hypothetical protein
MSKKVEQEIEPLVVPVWPDAGMALGLSRNGTYAAVARGEIPVLSEGHPYMLGRLGLARIVLLPGEATEDGTATWTLKLQEPPTPQATAAPPQKVAPREPRRQPARRRSNYPSRRVETAASSLPHDSVSDLFLDPLEAAP